MDTMMETGDCFVQEEESAWNEEVDITQLCRICANPSEYLIPIFEGEGLEHELEKKIEKHLPIKVSRVDELPTNLCYQCASTLIAWHDMVVSFVEADDKLKAVIHSRSKVLHEKDSIAENDGNSKETITTPLTNNTVPVSKVQEPVTSDDADDAVEEEEMSSIKPEITENENDETTDTRFLSFRNYQVAICALKDKLMNLKIKQRKPSKNLIFTSEVNTSASITVPCNKTSSSPSEVEEINNLDCGEMFGKPKHQCDICGRMFTRPYDLKRHGSIHLNEDVFESIGSCGTSNEKHEESINKIIVTHTCEICAKVFKAKDSYERHKRIHTNERPFRCDECGKCFRHSGALARHTKEVHAKVRNHLCNICNKWFLNRPTLEDHYRIHTGERPFVCHQCGLMFRSRAGLYQHSKTHSNFRPHTCDYCGKCFRRRQELIAHTPIHTNEKAHICEKCGKAFSTRSELHRHITVHSDEKPFSCLVCGFNFSQKRYLKNHIKSRHSRTEDSLHGIVPERF